MIYSVIYRPDNDTHYLYDREGRRILLPKDEESSLQPYGFSFQDDYNDLTSVAWAELLESLEIDEEVEYFRQAKTSGNMRDIISRVTNFWLDRGKRQNPAFPALVAWARKNMVAPERHEDEISLLYVGDAAIAALKKVFDKYCHLVRSREFLNYGHYWTNYDITRLLELRILHRKKFREIAIIMGRTNAAVRAEYGRIRRGEDNVTIELMDWEIMREAMPLGQFPKRKNVTLPEEKDEEQEQQESDSEVAVTQEEPDAEESSDGAKPKNADTQSGNSEAMAGES